MPQLDFIITSSQIFWLIVVFLLLYTVLTHFFLPKFIKVLKTRKRITSENEKKLAHLKEQILKKITIFDNVTNLNLIKIKVLIEKEIFLFFKNLLLIDLSILNKRTANVLYFNLISYDINVLESINIKPVF